MRQVLSQMTRKRYGNLASKSIGWVLHGTVLEEPLKSSIGGLPKYSVLLTLLLTLASSFLLKKMTSFKGQIISASPLSGNISRIMTRHCVLSTLSVQHWEEKIELDQYRIEELRFWRTNLNSLKVRDCFLIHKPQCFVYSDAVANECGSVINLMRSTSVTDCGNHPNAPKVLLGEGLPPLIFLSNRSPQFWRVPSSSGLRIVGTLSTDDEWDDDDE